MRHASRAAIDLEGCRSIRALREDYLNRVRAALGQEERLAKFDLRQRERLRAEDFRRGGHGHLQIGRGWQHGDALDAVVIEIGQGIPVQSGFPEVGSRRMRRAEMLAQKRMASCPAPRNVRSMRADAPCRGLKPAT